MIARPLELLKRRGEKILHSINANDVDDDEDACGNAIIKNNSEDDVQGDGGVRVIAEISDEKTRFQDLETNKTVLRISLAIQMQASFRPPYLDQSFL